MLKSELRKIYLLKRSKITHQERKESSLKAAKIFTNLSLFKQSEHIACYLSFKNEFDTERVIEVIWQAKKYCYLPVLCFSNSGVGKSLTFVRYQQGDPLQLNRYNILEPVKKDHQLLAEDLDIVVTPLVAFDLNGNRIGMGAGYYDTTFAFLKSSVTNKPKLYGLAFSEQFADILPHDPWDILLDGIITENEFIDVKKSS